MSTVSPYPRSPITNMISTNRETSMQRSFNLVQTASNNAADDKMGDPQIKQVAIAQRENGILEAGTFNKVQSVESKVDIAIERLEAILKQLQAPQAFSNPSASAAPFKQLNFMA